MLSEIEFTDSLTDNSGERTERRTIRNHLSLDAASISSNNSNELESPVSSLASSPASVPDLFDTIDNCSITTEINKSGLLVDAIETLDILFRCLFGQGREVRDLRDLCLL